MILTTDRLRLRPFANTDALAVAALAGDPRVARMLVDIPLPFGEAAARQWLRSSMPELRLGIEREGKLIGGVCYFCNLGGATSLGYWLGVDHWGRGYASEAASALVKRGFARERMQVFRSAHFVDNPASGAVLRRIGFRAVGETAVWCPARGLTVRAVTYTLTRAGAGYAPVRMTWAGCLGFRPFFGHRPREAAPSQPALHPGHSLGLQIGAAHKVDQAAESQRPP